MHSADPDESDLWFWTLYVIVPVPETGGKDMIFMYGADTQDDADRLKGWLVSLLKAFVDDVEISEAEITY